MQAGLVQPSAGDPCQGIKCIAESWIIPPHPQLTSLSAVAKQNSTARQSEDWSDGRPPPLSRVSSTRLARARNGTQDSSSSSSSSSPSKSSPGTNNSRSKQRQANATFDARARTACCVRPSKGTHHPVRQCKKPVRILIQTPTGKCFYISGQDGTWNSGMLLYIRFPSGMQVT